MMTNSFVSFYIKYKQIIFCLLLINNILCTIYCYIKYRKKSYKQLYFLYSTYGCSLLSIGVFLYLLKFLLGTTFNTIGNNIIYYYKLPVIIVIGGFLLIIIGAHKERYRGGK